VKIFMMTDLEGCAGVCNARDYIHWDSRYYEYACELATLEVSAAVEGALEAGATEVIVMDGHGPGAMKRQLLHPRARLMTGRPVPPAFGWGIDGTFSAGMILGQHAMSNTDGGHLAHTMSFDVEEYLLNGAPIGEMGLVMLRAGYYGIPVVFVSGDEAACAEARAMVPNIEAEPVKFGISRGPASGLTGEENAAFNSVAVHLHPDEARALIREHAYRAVKRIPEIAPYRIEPPYTLTVAIRPEAGKKKGKRTVRKARDFIDLMGLRPKPLRGTPSKKKAPSKSAAKKSAKKPAKKTAKKSKKKTARKGKKKTKK